MFTIERAADYDDMSARAAQYLYRFIESTPTGVLALPTGRTPVGTYDRVIEEFRVRPLDCARLFLADVDEIVGLSVDHPASCAYTLRRQFVGRHPASTAACRLLDGAASDAAREIRFHEEEIERRGGLSLVVLGIGVNGHIALNEPGTPFDSLGHVSTLTRSTVERLSLSAATGATGLTLGLTLGIGSLLRARRVLLLASGEEKAEILETALDGEITESVPASALQMHQELHVIADEAALASWNPRD